MTLVITEASCFYPDSHDYLFPDRWGLDWEPWDFTSPEGRLLTGWHIQPGRDSPNKSTTVLHLHGNAQNMSAHLLGSFFLARHGFRLMTFDYRGYGRSEGYPTLKGIIADASAALRHLLENPPAPQERLAIFGQSMGAFTSAHVLPDFPQVDKAVLEAGLVSFRDLFIEAYPEADIRVPDGFSTLEPLSRSRTPKLFIHGTSDAVVPLSHSQRMHSSAAAPKELLILPGVGHIDALDSPQAALYVDRITSFLSPEAANR